MNGHQQAWRYTLGTLIACLLLALVWWMVRNLGGDGPGYATITVDDPALRQMAEASARAEARRREMREKLEKRVPDEASVPWVRSAMLPEPAEVAVAALPFATRRPDRPTPVHVYPARVPPIGKRHSLASPDLVKLPLALAPWTARRTRSHVSIEPARLPHLPRLRDVHAPDAATVAVASVPWRTGRLAEPESAGLSPAVIPWLSGRVAGGGPAVVVTAQVPAIRPRPDPARPWPARVPEAQSPWVRDAARPLERHLYEAHVPSRLRAMNAGGQ